MITFKPGVKVGRARPVVSTIILVVGSCYAKLGYDCVVTSIDDGQHKTDSLHYLGQAVDFRLNDLSGIPIVHRVELVKLVQSAFGVEFDVLHEFRGTPDEHLHVEHDPK